MYRKGGQLEFNHMNDVDPCISLPGQFDTNNYPTAATYHPRPEAEALLAPRNAHSTAQNAMRNVRPLSNLSPLIVNPQGRCGSHCSCCQSSPLFFRDYGSENVHPTPSPQFYPYSRFPSTTDTNPSGASMSDIEVAVADEDGQNPLLQATGTSSRLSGHSNTNKSFNLNCSPNDNMLQPAFPSTPNSLNIERCMDQCCDNEKCRWHSFVIQYPHMIRWQDEVRTIELKKSSNESFGFSFKAKKHRNVSTHWTFIKKNQVFQRKYGISNFCMFAFLKLLHTI